MASGACNCGAVAFEITTAIEEIFVCHCSICRRATGSNGIAVVVVPGDQFRWTAGEANIQRWDKPGHDYQMSFCTTCGSPVPGINSETTMFVPAGLIADGANNLNVAHHIWVGSKAPWDQIGDEGRQHPEAFDNEG